MGVSFVHCVGGGFFKELMNFIIIIVIDQKEDINVPESVLVSAHNPIQNWVFCVYCYVCYNLCINNSTYYVTFVSFSGAATTGVWNESAACEKINILLPT